MAKYFNIGIITGLTLLVWMNLARGDAAPPSAFLTLPNSVAGGSHFQVSVFFLNHGSDALKTNLPSTLNGTVTSSLGVSRPLTAVAIPGQRLAAEIKPMGFVSCQYSVVMPENTGGMVTLAWRNLDVPSMTIQVIAKNPVATGQPQTTQSDSLPQLDSNPSNHTVHASQAGEFLKRHLFAYEPVYFVGGTKSPNAKFQFSFKYRLFDPEKGLSKRINSLSDLYFGYTQTSLWDLNQPSAPFLDTSYKPELMYSHGIWGNSNAWFSTSEDMNDWFALDLQGGVQHESNGRDGLNSRSLNLTYLRPSIRFGYSDALNLTLSPKIWVYVDSLSDNPDLRDYRGHADLTARLNWKDRICLSSLIRCGDDFDNAGFQTDLSFALWPKKTGMTWRFHIQYFTGYGESFLNYRERNEMLRLGFSLYH